MYIYLNVCKQMIEIKLLLLHSNTWNHLTLYKKISSGVFKNFINKVCLQIIYEVPSISFRLFFVQAFKIVVDSWKFPMLLLYILWDDWPIFMISGSNEQLQQQLEYTLLKPDLSQLVNFKNAIWTWGHFRRTICNKILF